ncbi:DMT family transporter [Thiohalophilus thiocyanatoxydans]|uniref:Drug/metabolite transporter (DMT)-like permease n=1 Tax=Thiohalophilus thiocyanatoxydans TaxID=381308 RepID=A0A4R8ISJ3_9GAMM|nr:DMT family transporter [Thiohalophilus thiocyanatoxydans]TDY00607.1 drug/metabolite transporter (DMT)-like permease [Thiohalophilus thiocyanatoxydans]
MKQMMLRLFGLELLFVLLWNSGFIGAEYGLPFAGPWTLLFWRYLILTLLLGIWLGLHRRLTWPGNAAAGYTATVGILAHGVWLACVLISLDMGVPAGIVALVTALQPLLTGALSGPVLGERTDAWQWLGLILGFFGVLIAVGARISQDTSIGMLAYLIPFGSVVAITVASLLQRRRERHSLAPRLGDDTTLFYQSAATTLALLLPAWLVEDFATDWTLPFIATMSWLILVVSLGAYWSMWRLLVRHDATRVASLFYLSPPVTMLMAWAFFGDRLILTDVIGLVVAAVGVLLVYRLGFRRPTIRVLPPR